MQRRVRDSRAGYFQSLEVLRAAKAEGVYTKSSLMLGLGETDDEIIDAMLDLRAAGGRNTPGCYLCRARHGLKSRSASNSQLARFRSRLNCSKSCQRAVGRKNCG